MRRSRRPVSITDAAPSLGDDQRRRKRHYTILMVVHLVGFAASGVVFPFSRWVAVALVVGTTALPWIAVILANDASR